MMAKWWTPYTHEPTRNYVKRMRIHLADALLGDAMVLKNCEVHGDVRLDDGDVYLLGHNAMDTLIVASGWVYLGGSLALNGSVEMQTSERV